MWSSCVRQIEVFKVQTCICKPRVTLGSDVGYMCGGENRAESRCPIFRFSIHSYTSKRKLGPKSQLMYSFIIIKIPKLDARNPIEIAVQTENSWRTLGTWRNVRVRGHSSLVTRTGGHWWMVVGGGGWRSCGHACQLVKCRLSLVNLSLVKL